MEKQVTTSVRIENVTKTHVVMLVFAGASYMAAKTPFYRETRPLAGSVSLQRSDAAEFIAQLRPELISANGLAGYVITEGFSPGGVLHAAQDVIDAWPYEAAPTAESPDTALFESVELTELVNMLLGDKTRKQLTAGTSGQLHREVLRLQVMLVNIYQELTNVQDVPESLQRPADLARYIWDRTIDLFENRGTLMVFNLEAFPHTSMFFAGTPEQVMAYFLNPEKWTLGMSLKKQFDEQMQPVPFKVDIHYDSNLGYQGDIYLVSADEKVHFAHFNCTHIIRPLVD